MKSEKKWKRPATFEDLNAIPAELRTKPHEEYDSGVWWFYEPMTVVRSDACGLEVEIVRVRSCMDRDCELGHCQMTGCHTHYEAHPVSIALLEDMSASIEGLETSGP